MTNILFFSGSIRKGSSNTKLIQAIHKKALDMGAKGTLISLEDFSMPIYNGDLEAEQGLPDSVKELKKIFLEHDALCIASPEYNSAFSPLLKNTLDWVSRPAIEGEPMLYPFKGKVAAICSASPGSLGGMRGLSFLRMLLSNISMTVVPTQVCLSNSYSAFDEQGNLEDDQMQQFIDKMLEELIHFSK